MVQHLVLKGRHKPLWYWQPSKTLREAGWATRRLADDPATARQEAERINADVERWRLSRAMGTDGRAIVPGSVKALITAYRASEDYAGLAASTRHRYLQCLEIIGAELGEARTKAVTPPVVQAIKTKLKATPVQCNHVLRTLRLLWNFGIRQGLVTTGNPAAKFRQLGERPRTAVWSREAEAAFLAAAGPELALAYLLAVWTAQRQGDLLRLPWSAYDGRTIRLRQGKTGADLEVHVSRALQAALDATQRRATMILTRPDGLPWKRDHFCHAFGAAIRAAGLKGLRFQDLRRTAVVRMAEAGATVPQVASVTGHKIDTCQAIIDTYLPRTRALSQAAITRLERKSR
jgi:integrase